MMKHDFIIKHNRRNLIVDLDRTFVDIILMHDFHNQLRSKISEIRNAFSEDMHEITFNGHKFVVVIRKGTYEFF